MNIDPILVLQFDFFQNITDDRGGSFTSQYTSILTVFISNNRDFKTFFHIISKIL